MVLAQSSLPNCGGSDSHDPLRHLFVAPFQQSEIFCWSFLSFFMATSDSTGRRLTCAIDIFLWRYPLVLIVNLSSVHQLLCNQSASCQCICSWLHEKLDGCYPRCVSRTHLEHIIGIALRINRSSNSPAQYKLNPAHPISLRLRTFLSQSATSKDNALSFFFW
jgi:hypothetical protein